MERYVRRNKSYIVFGNERGRISLFLPDEGEENPFWEILCIKGDLFEGEERYVNITRAVKRISDLLGEQA